MAAISGSIQCFSQVNFTGTAIALAPGLNVSDIGAWNRCSLKSLQVPSGMALVAYSGTKFQGQATRYDTNMSSLDNGTMQSFAVIDRADAAHFLVDVDDASTLPLVLSVGDELAAIDASMDMSISAMHIPPGAIVRGFKRRYFLGQSAMWSGHHTTLGDEWNNRIRSIQVLPSKTPSSTASLPRPFVRFFLLPNFTTLTWQEDEGSAMPTMDDWPYSVEKLQPASIHVPDGLTLLQFNATNFQGAYRTWTKSIDAMPPTNNSYFMMRSYKVVNKSTWNPANTNASEFVTCVSNSGEMLPVYLRVGDQIANRSVLGNACSDLVIVPKNVAIIGHSQHNFGGPQVVWNEGVYSNKPFASMNSLKIINSTDTPTSGTSSWILWLIIPLVLLAVVIAWIVYKVYSRRTSDPSFQAQPSLKLLSVHIDENCLEWGDLELVRLDSSQIVRTRFIASGGSGEVWQGTFRGTTRVAIKTLHHYTPETVQRFIREINILASIQSPHIVALIGAIWTRPSDLAAVCEFMENGDLSTFLQTTPRREIPWKMKFTFASQVAEGIFCIHSMQYIHRDLKSRNVLLGSNGAKVADLGATTDRDVDETRTAGVGTYRWMAPEVLAFQPYSSAVDIYSFGVVLSELDTQKTPYSNQFENESVLIGKILREGLRPSFTNDCPLWYRYLALRCMAVEPKERPTASEVLHVLMTHLSADAVDDD